MIRIANCLSAAPLAMLLVVIGCRQDLPTTAPVRGIVLLDGKPLSGFDNAAVLLTPRSGRMASGVIDQDGAFELSTVADRDGAPVGPADVTVSATVDDPNAANVERGIGVRWMIPERFSSEDSGLQCEVLPGEENVFRIELQSDGTGQMIREE